MGLEDEYEPSDAEKEKITSHLNKRFGFVGKAVQEKIDKGATNIGLDQSLAGGLFDQAERKNGTSFHARLVRWFSRNGVMGLGAKVKKKFVNIALKIPGSAHDKMREQYKAADKKGKEELEKKWMGVIKTQGSNSLSNLEADEDE